MQVTAVLTPAKEGGYVAYNPETACMSQGETAEEALTNLNEAVALYIEEFPTAPYDKPLVTFIDLSVNE